MSQTIKLHKLGTFEVVSNKLIISDPMFDVSPEMLPSGNCISNVIEVKNGIWHAYVYEKSNRISKLVIHHSNIQLNDIFFTSNNISRMESTSGLAGFFDAKHYRDNTIICDSINLPIPCEDKWYDMCSYITNNSQIHSGIVPYGVVSIRCYDEEWFYVYPGYHKNDTSNSNLLALQLIFFN